MFDFIKNIFRKRSLKRHASVVPTEILPLSKIKSYVAIIDVEDPSFDACKTTITKKDLDWLGRPNKYKMGVLEERAPDVFISLIKEPDFAIEYMARTSKARFKIGRKQLGGDLFDLVVSDPAGKDLSQLDSFNAMKSYLGKIR